MNNKSIKVYSLILVVVATSLAVPLIPLGGTVYYIYVILILLYSVFTKTISFDYLLLLFIVWSALGILLNNPNPFFHSWERLGAFSLVISVLSPLLKNNFLYEFRIRAFSYTLLSVVIISVGSFIAYFLGINYMTMAVSTGAGSFGGLTSQSMLLAPICGMSFCFLLWRLFAISMGKKEKVFHLLFALLSFIVLMIAASRGAFVATVAGSAMIVYQFYRRSFGKLLKTVLLVLALGVICFPVIEPYAANLIEKQQNNEMRGGTTASRDSKWDNRIEEFCDSPVFGVGFATIADKHIEEDASMHGVVETGSSWLAILSMTGLVGFVLFFCFYLKNSWRLFSSEDITSVLLNGLLMFFAVHMIVEGYVLYAGSYLFYLMWLSLGASNAKLNTDIHFDLIDKPYLKA